MITSLWEMIQHDRFRGGAFAAKFTLANRRTLPYYRNLMHWERRTRDELAAYQWTKCQRLIRFAYAHVPYYRRRFTEYGLHPSQFVSPEDFSRIPLLTKDDVRAHLPELIADTARSRHLAPCTTGGSTGDPLTVYHDARVPDYAMGWRMLSWWGVPPWADAAYVWRSVMRSQAQRAAREVFWWPTKRLFLDASSFSTADALRFLAAWNRFRPRLLQGYTGAICHVASIVADRTMAVHAPDAIWVTSSPVSLVQRRMLEQAFRAPVYSQYGCGEVYWIAAECPAHDGLHVFSDTRFVEYVNDDGALLSDGEQGRIVVTDLENYACPLIRYVNGDVGRSRRTQCPCGVTLPLMDEVTGRVTDNVVLPDGTCIGGDYLTTIFDDVPDAVRAFQVRQRRDRSLMVLVVPSADRDITERALHRVREILRTKTRGQVPITMEIVTDIPHDRGKFRYVVSERAVGS